MGAIVWNWVVGSIGRGNTVCEGLRGCPVEQGLSGALVELSGDGAERGLAVQG